MHKLLDHTRPGEADQRARFGKANVALHGETGRHAACSRVCQEADVWNADFSQFRDNISVLNGDRCLLNYCLSMNNGLNIVFEGEIKYLLAPSRT